MKIGPIEWVSSKCSNTSTTYLFFSLPFRWTHSSCLCVGLLGFGLVRFTRALRSSRCCFTSVSYCYYVLLSSKRCTRSCCVPFWRFVQVCGGILRIAMRVLSSGLVSHEVHCLTSWFLLFGSRRFLGCVPKVDAVLCWP